MRLWPKTPPPRPPRAERRKADRARDPLADALEAAAAPQATTEGPQRGTGAGSAAAVAGALGQDANTPTPPPPDDEPDAPLRRRLAYLSHAARVLQPYHPWRVRDDGAPRCSRISLCGWSPVDGGTLMLEVSSAGKASVSGVQRCGSVWTCASCASKVMDERAREVAHAVRHAMGSGRAVYMVTLTVRHTYGDDLRTMRRGMGLAWSGMVNGAPWARRRDAYGINYLRRLESTVGANGWHPHFHALFASDTPLSPFDGEDGRPSFWHWLRERWNAMVGLYLGEQHVGEAPWDVHVEEITAADGATRYLTKLGLEVTDAFTRKRARNGNRTPWGVLQTVADRLYQDDAEAEECAALWGEWATAMHGARALVWDRTWRKACGLASDVRDEVIAQREEADTTPVAMWPREHARELAKPHVSLPVRRAVEHGADAHELTEVVRRATASDAIAVAFGVLNDGVSFDELARRKAARARELRERMVVPPPPRPESILDHWTLAMQRAVERGRDKVRRRMERARNAERLRLERRRRYGWCDHEHEENEAPWCGATAETSHGDGEARL